MSLDVSSVIGLALTDTKQVLEDSLNRLGSSTAEVQDLINKMWSDVALLKADLEKQPSMRVKALILNEIQTILENRKVHILAIVEAKAGIEAKRVAEAALDVGLTIAVKLLKLI